MKHLFSKRTKVAQSFKSALVFMDYFIIPEYLDKLCFCTLEMFLGKQCCFPELEGSYPGTQSHLHL